MSYHVGDIAQALRKFSEIRTSYYKVLLRELKGYIVLLSVQPSIISDLVLELKPDILCCIFEPLDTLFIALTSMLPLLSYEINMFELLITG